MKRKNNSGDKFDLGVVGCRRVIFKDLPFKQIPDRWVEINQGVYTGRERHSMLRETACAKGCEVETGLLYLKSWKNAGAEWALSPEMRESMQGLSGCVKKDFILPYEATEDKSWEKQRYDLKIRLFLQSVGYYTVLLKAISFRSNMNIDK